jgi:hypothetical protein
MVVARAQRFRERSAIGMRAGGTQAALAREPYACRGASYSYLDRLVVEASFYASFGPVTRRLGRGTL